MPVDDSTPNDESTRKRTDPPSALAKATGPNEISQQPESQQPGSDSSTSEIVAQANTVIRGSPRGDRPGNPLQGSPAVITKVLLGQQLNQYLIEDQIGGGGMGAVFRAHDQQLDRIVAIKVVPFVGEDVDLQRRFRNEAQNAAKLDDPRVARVYDAGNHNEWHYIVFEFVEGTNIRDQVVSNGFYTIDDAVYYTSQLAGAIQHLSNRGIVHRDIKPSNVIISSDGSLKLVDMGLARSEHLEMSDDMTASGVTLGTFDYISPEQARDPRNADLRSDIYSLGCTLYFMLTGSPPYPGGTMAQKLISHGTAPPPDAQEIRPAVSHHLQAVLNKMLAKSPSDRYGDANDLLADLREVARRDGLSRTFKLAPVPLGQPTPLPGWLYKFSPWIAASVVLLASAGWLRLESASLREDVSIPSGAMAPEPSSSSEQIQSNAPFENTPLETPQKNASIESTDLDDIEIDRSDNDAIQTPPEGDQASETGLASVEPPDDAPLDLDTGPPRVIRLVDNELNAQNRRDESGAALTNSFAAAIKMAREFGVGQIEITTPIVRSEPVRILGAEPLIIRSTVGGSTIVFRNDTSTQDSDSALVSIASNRIEFEDLHFVWEGEQTDERKLAFFAIRGNRQIRLNRCSVSVKNQSENENVFGFQVSPASPWQTFGQEFLMATASQAAQLEIRNTVIRGQMTMISLDGNSDLKLIWNNGLLAISGRMIDASGTRIEPGFRQRRSMELILTRLTAHVPQGLVRIRMSSNGPDPMSIDRQALNSLFLIDSGLPQFEFLGSASNVNLPDRLRLHGTSNSYCTDGRDSELMVRIKSEDDPGQVISINEIQTEAPSWFQEPAASWIDNPWANSNVGTIQPADRTAQDYQQDDPSSPGFDFESLPQIPVVGAEDCDADGAEDSDADGDEDGDEDGDGAKSSTDRLSTARELGKTPDLRGNSEPDLTFTRSSDLIGGSAESVERP
jgi:serine/threonine protein kinase